MHFGTDSTHTASNRSLIVLILTTKKNHHYLLCPTCTTQAPFNYKKQGTRLCMSLQLTVSPSAAPHPLTSSSSLMSMTSGVSTSAHCRNMLQKQSQFLQKKILKVSKTFQISLTASGGPVSSDWRELAASVLVVF